MRKMTKLSLFALPFIALSLFMLTACQTNNNYTRPAWTYNSGQTNQAESAPSTIADNFDKSAAPATQVNQQQPIGTPGTVAEVKAQKAALRPVKVGLLLPLSGAQAQLGEAMLQSAQLALFDAGYENFELLPRDTMGTADGARKAAQDSVNDGAELILGPVFAESVRAAKPITRRAGINMVAFSTDWGLSGGNTFIMGFLPFDQVERVIRYSAQSGLSHIAIIAPDTDYGRVVVSAYKSYAPRYDIETSKIEMFPANIGNLSPTMRQFTEYDERETFKEQQEQENGTESPMTLPPPYDAVLMPVGGELAISVANLMSHYDLPPKMVRRLGTGLFDDLSLATESSLGGAWFAAPNPQHRLRFESRFRKNYGYAPPRLASLAYDSTALAAILAKRGLQTQGRPMFDQTSITNPNGFAGIDGIFRFRPDGTVERGLAVLEFQNGRLNVVDPAPSTFQNYARF